MSLMKPVPSDQTRRALVAGVKDFVSPGDPLGEVLLQAPQGLHVFALGLLDIANGTGVQGAKSAGWRFLAGSPVGPAVSGDVIEREGEAPKMTGLSQDPLVGAAIRATDEVEPLREVQAVDYTLQVFRTPGRVLDALE